MPKKQSYTLILPLLATLVIAFFIIFSLWHSIKPANQNQNASQVNINQNKNTNIQANVNRVQEGVTITTDKVEYQAGETINIVIANNQPEVVYTEFAGGWDIYRFKDNNWDKLELSCGCKPTCIDEKIKFLEPCPLPVPPLYKYQEFKSPQETTWDQNYCLTETKKCGEEDYIVGNLKVADPGEYKVEFCYWDKKEVDLSQPPGTALENTKKCIEKEFTIKGELTCRGFGGIKCPDGYYCYFKPEDQVVADAEGICKSITDIKTQEECETLGAHWTATGAIARVCEFSSPDAGNVCTKADDCTRGCRIKDAKDKTGTCSEYSLGGCYWYLDDDGNAQGICID